MPLALITGASKGFGRAIAEALAERGWTLIVDARAAAGLADAARGHTSITPVAGDVTDPGHRQRLAALVDQLGGRLDLLINNASTLGTSPLPQLADYPLDELRQVYETNVIAPLALIQAIIEPLTATGGTIINISSDAAAEAYPGWGGYGSSKAGLTSSPPCWARRSRGCGAMRSTPATCGRRCTSRPSPARTSQTAPSRRRSVPALLRLLDERPPSGRYPGHRVVDSPRRQPDEITSKQPARGNGGWPGTGCGYWPPRRTGWPTPPSPISAGT